MSTIAFKEGFMVAEGQITADSTAIAYDYDKISIHDLGPNTHMVIGLTGDPSDEVMLIANIKNILIGEPVEHSPECRGLVVLVKKGEEPDAFLYENGALLPMGKNPIAIGSGEVPALTVMKHGGDALEAIRMACELDIYSGGQIKKVNVKTKKTSILKK